MIFSKIWETMDVWTSHKDEVQILPPDFKLLAISPVCDIEAMKHEVKPMYGIQFHPEVQHTEKGYMIFKNFYNVCKEFKINLWCISLNSVFFHRLFHNNRLNYGLMSHPIRSSNLHYIFLVEWLMFYHQYFSMLGRRMWC